MMNQPAENGANSCNWAIIPARGGSKGLRRKAEREVGGVPLLGRTILAARAAASVQRVLVSTDDKAFARLALAYGADVPFLRPACLATDTTPITDVIDHLLHQVDGPAPDQIVLLQSTSPFLEGPDIDRAHTLLADGVEAVTSVCRTEVQPDWLRHVDEQGWLAPLGDLAVPQHTPRQAMPVTYRLNGALYWVRTPVYQQKRTLLPSRCRAYVMHQERSLDIDSPWDLDLARWVHDRYHASLDPLYLQENTAS